MITNASPSSYPLTVDAMQRARRRPKVKNEKSDDEFKEHERILMSKRTEEINLAITKVYCLYFLYSALSIILHHTT